MYINYMSERRGMGVEGREDRCEKKKLYRIVFVFG